MFAALFTLGVFLAWTALGAAVLVVMRADLTDLRVALTAPILGTAVMVIPLFILSNAGVSMEACARPVGSVLVVAALTILAWRRPRFPSGIFPVAAISLVGLVLVGHPIFQFGFNWIANANGDMAYYVLSATHLLGHGLQSPVDFHALAENRGFSSTAQQLNLRGLRPGTQIALAGMASGTGLSPVSVYMPMSLALSMGTVWATGALALQATRRWWAASVAAGLLVVSPMAAYGIVQQLLPQNWGLGLSAALFAWLMRPETHKRPRLLDLVVISALTAALFVVAYEVASSLIVGYVLYALAVVVRRKASLRGLALLWGIPLILTVAVVNTFLPRATSYIRHYVFAFGTSSGFTRAGGLSIFGYAVVPTAVPGAAGFRSLFAPPATPHMGLFILIGAAFFALVVFAAFVTAFRGAAAGVIVLSFLILGLMLARNSNDFGLFKLFMYAQPFVAATLAVFMTQLRGRLTATVFAGLLVGIVILQVPTSNAYVRHSFNPVDLPNASASSLLPAFRHVLDQSAAPVVTVTDNFALERLEGALAEDRTLYFMGRNPYGLAWKQTAFRLSEPDVGDRRSTFSQDQDAARILSNGRCTLVLPSGSEMAMNRRSLPEGSPALHIVPCRDAHDLLAFITSSLGQPSTLPDNRRDVSFWQLEADPSFPGRTFSGFGRYALFEVLGSASRVRMVLDFTTSPTQLPSTGYRLPPATVVGGGRVPFDVVGSGSARVISPPLTPRMIGGRPYVVLDMGRPGEFPTVPRPGLTGLWGRSIVLDPRALTSYVRDVSLIPAADDRVRAPTAIRSIPADLANPNLAYSGIFEDGWVGQRSYARLAGGPASRLTIQALVLARPQGQSLRVVVDGRTVASRTVRPGQLRLSVAIPAAGDVRTVELRWGGVVKLAAPDRRSAAARLTFLGVAPPPRAVSSVPAGLRDPGLSHSGIFSDGWLEQDARLVLAGGAAGTLDLRVLVTTPGERLELRVNDRVVAAQPVARGTLELRAAIPASTSSRAIELRWSKTARIGPNDRRRAAGLLRSIAVQAP